MKNSRGRETLKNLSKGLQGEGTPKYYLTVTSVLMIIKCMTKKACEIKSKSNQHLWWKQNSSSLSDQYPIYRVQKSQLFIPNGPCFVYLPLVLEILYVPYLNVTTFCKTRIKKLNCSSLSIFKEGCKKNLPLLHPCTAGINAFSTSRCRRGIIYNLKMFQA